MPKAGGGRAEVPRDAEAVRADQEWHEPRRRAAAAVPGRAVEGAGVGAARADGVCLPEGAEGDGEGGGGGARG